MQRTGKPFQVAFVSVAIILTTAFLVWTIARYVTERPVSEWKRPAIERLTLQSLTNDPIRAELEEISSSNATNNPDLAWAHNHVLRMTHGETITYEYRHGRNVHFPRHLFIGRTSTGQWLYSRYHFCNSMSMVQFDKPPASIAEFAQRYQARPFTGKPEDIP